jgi:hypothetical protein
MFVLIAPLENRRHQRNAKQKMQESESKMMRTFGVDFKQKKLENTIHLLAEVELFCCHFYNLSTYRQTGCSCW